MMKHYLPVWYCVAASTISKFGADEGAIRAIAVSLSGEQFILENFSPHDSALANFRSLCGHLAACWTIESNSSPAPANFGAHRWLRCPATGIVTLAGEVEGCVLTAAMRRNWWRWYWAQDTRRNFDYMLNQRGSCSIIPVLRPPGDRYIEFGIYLIASDVAS